MRTILLAFLVMAEFAANSFLFRFAPDQTLFHTDGFIILSDIGFTLTR